MASVVKNLAELEDADRQAIAAYLKAIPPHPNGYPAKLPAGPGPIDRITPKSGAFRFADDLQRERVVERDLLQPGKAAGRTGMA